VVAEFGWTVPKATVAGETDRVSFSVAAVVVLGFDKDESPPHAVKGNDRAKVRKTSRKAKVEKSSFANLSPGEDFIFRSLRRTFGIAC
jgi:hypothetical protein